MMRRPGQEQPSTDLVGPDRPGGERAELGAIPDERFVIRTGTEIAIVLATRLARKPRGLGLRPRRVNGAVRRPRSIPFSLQIDMSPLPDSNRPPLPYHHAASDFS
jgi:hypothetical protein